MLTIFSQNLAPNVEKTKQFLEQTIEQNYEISGRSSFVSLPSQYSSGHYFPATSRVEITFRNFDLMGDPNPDWQDRDDPRNREIMNTEKGEHFRQMIEQEARQFGLQFTKITLNDPQEKAWLVLAIHLL